MEQIAHRKQFIVEIIFKFRKIINFQNFKMSQCNDKCDRVFEFCFLIFLIIFRILNVDFINSLNKFIEFFVNFNHD